MTRSTVEATELANAAISDRYTPKHETAFHTPDGGVYVGRDRDDIAAHMLVGSHLVRRRARGRDPLVADILGCLEDDAAWKRGERT